MRFIDVLERINVQIGRAVSWLTVLMVLVTFFVVVMRYLFDSGWIWLQETVSWMHAAVFLLAAAYTLAREEHVRVDIFYRGFSPRGRALVDAAGTVLLLIPVTLFIIIESSGYVLLSWQIHESSAEAGGLVYPLPSMLKSMIPAMSIMLLMQGIVILGRAIQTLRTSD